MGCTDCGRKGGCDTRKHGMFAAVDEALARLYPTKQWGERDEDGALGQGISADEGMALAAALAKKLNTSALYRAGDEHEWCDYIYVLCLGRQPSIAEIRAGVAPAPVDLETVAGAETDVEAETLHLEEDGGETGLDERYLRVVLSGLARFAGVQEVAMTLRRRPGEGDVVITERARGGVFDPILLPRFQSLVAVLAEWDIRHLDFGEIVEPPVDFAAKDYEATFGTLPVIANYFFYPQPPTTVSTVVIAGPLASPPGRISSFV